MDMMYNKQGNRLTFAWPIGSVMAELFDKIGWFDRVLALVSYLVAMVATASILAGIYNSMNERRREIAILRALGARRFTIFSAILLEAASISALGMAAGFVSMRIVTVVAGRDARANGRGDRSLQVQCRHALGSGHADHSRRARRNYSGGQSLPHGRGGKPGANVLDQNETY